MEIINTLKYQQADRIGVLSKRSKPSSFTSLAIFGMMFQIFSNYSPSKTACLAARWVPPKQDQRVPLLLWKTWPFSKTLRPRIQEIRRQEQMARKAARRLTEQKMSSISASEIIVGLVFFSLIVGKMLVIWLDSGELMYPYCNMYGLSLYVIYVYIYFIIEYICIRIYIYMWYIKFSLRLYI